MTCKNQGESPFLTQAAGAGGVDPAAQDSQQRTDASADLFVIDLGNLKQMPPEEFCSLWILLLSEAKRRGLASW